MLVDSPLALYMTEANETQWLPHSLAGLIPSHGSGGWVLVNRRPPRGGNPNGMPRKTSYGLSII